MSGLKRALGGLLAGYGSGLAAQAKFDMETAAKLEENDALMRRQIALQQSQQTAAHAETEYKEDRQDQRLVGEIKLRAAADADKDQRRFEFDSKLEAQKFDQDIKKLGVQFSQNQKMEAFKTAQNIAQYNATTGAQNPITSTKVAEDGTLYGVRKDGSVSKISDVKFPKAQGINELLMGLGAGGDEDGGGAPAPAPSGGQPPAQKPQGNVVPQQEWINLNQQALQKGQAGDPRFKGLTQSQIAEKVRAGLVAKGYQVPY